MNWGEIKQAVLHKLDGPDQDLAEEYKSRMIPAANEGLYLLATGGKPIYRQEEVEVTEDTPLLQLSSLPCYWELDRLYQHQEEGLRPIGSYVRQGDTLILAPGRYQAAYWALEEPVTGDTPDDHTFRLAPEALSLLPLYIASQLYKHDNAQLAVIWRNEFESGRDLLQLNHRERRRQPGTAEFESLPWAGWGRGQ